MKKLLIALVALCLSLPLAACGSGDPETSPTPNYDGSTPSDLLGPTPEPTPTPDPQPVTLLTVNGVNLVRDGQLTGLGYAGFSYADGVLTIDSVTVNCESASHPLLVVEGGALEIVVAGECALNSTGGTAAISSDGDLSFSGEGSLTVSASEAAGIDCAGSVTASCALNVSGAPAISAAITAGAGYAVTEGEGTVTVAAAA